jgi:hypothetical protein
MGSQIPETQYVSQCFPFSSVGTSALSRLHHSRCQTFYFTNSQLMICRNSYTILSHFRYSQTRVFVTWSAQHLGSHPANFRVREISRSLQPVFHSLLQSHMLPFGCRGIRVSQYHDSCCELFGTSPCDSPIHDSTCRSDGSCGMNRWLHPS